VTVTTTFTAGDNNVFGPFTRTTVCSLNLGLRAPVVISVTPSSGNCAVVQDLLITGACFTFTSGDTVATVTSVFAKEVGGTQIIQATDFTILNANLLDAHFNFTSANAGKTFIIFVSNAFGTSRGLTTATGACAALGNEGGVLANIEFTCNAAGTPGGGGTADIAVVTGCKLNRQENGTFVLDVTGNNIKQGAAVTVGGVTPKKIKVLELVSGTQNPAKLRLVKRICNGLPGNVIITNPGAAASQPFNCTERCPGQ
jgi:hypothetical protein